MPQEKLAIYNKQTFILSKKAYIIESCVKIISACPMHKSVAIYFNISFLQEIQIIVFPLEMVWLDNIHAFIKDKNILI